MLLAATWTVVVWATRIPLLEPDATVSDWIRIGIGLLTGFAVGAVGLRYPSVPARGRAWINVGFAFVMVFLWLPSLLSVWTTDHQLAFRLVHTTLAAASMGFGVALAQRAQDTFRAVGPSEQHVDHDRGEERS
jgi:hypothetical protein